MRGQFCNVRGIPPPPACMRQPVRTIGVCSGRACRTGTQSLTRAMSSAIPVAAPFSFQKRRGKLEWREMAKIDLDRVNREVCGTNPQECGGNSTLRQPCASPQVDIDTLEAHLENLAFGSLTADGALVQTHIPRADARPPKKLL